MFSFLAQDLLLLLVGGLQADWDYFGHQFQAAFSQWPLMVATGAASKLAPYVLVFLLNCAVTVSCVDDKQLCKASSDVTLQMLLDAIAALTTALQQPTNSNAGM
jgi:hypothetical protein